MAEKIPVGRTTLTCNEAAAVAALLARVEVVPAYPITPQTIVVEKLAEFLAGREDVIFKNMESEHSMLGYAIAASHCGARVFTASSSQGILYAHEQFHRAGRERTPVVMAAANRALVGPWSLEPDHNDTMSQRDCGWIQLYCSSNQEALDDVLMAFKIAEKCLLPAMVCYEGFILSHAKERVEVPTQQECDKFLPKFLPPAEWLLDPDNPRAFLQVPTPEEYAFFQYRVEEAMRHAGKLIEKEARRFETVFGRPKVGLLETAGNPKAKAALVTIGTIGETAKLLLATEDIFLVRIHTFRPFPRKTLRDALKYVRRIVVVERSLSFGGTPPLLAEVKSALSGMPIPIHGAVAVGGMNVTEHTLKTAMEKTHSMKSQESLWILEEA